MPPNGRHKGVDHAAVRQGRRSAVLLAGALLILAVIFDQIRYRIIMQGR